MWAATIHSSMVSSFQQLTGNMLIIKFYQCLDSKCGSLVSLVSTPLKLKHHQCTNGSFFKKITQKTVGISRIRTRIVRVDGKHYDHLTTTTTAKSKAVLPYFVVTQWQPASIDPSLLRSKWYPGFVDRKKEQHHRLHRLPVWPEMVIYWTLGNFLKPLATINWPKSPTFLGNFCKGVKIFNFSSDIIFGQLL